MQSRQTTHSCSRLRHRTEGLTVPVDSPATAPTRSTTEKHIAPPRPSAVTRWVPLIVASLLPILFLRQALSPVSDPDTFWHIRAGEYLWETGRFVGPEPWSKFSGEPWVLHEWLPEVAYFFAAQSGGLPAVAWLSVASIVTFYVVLYWAAREQASVLPAAIAAAAGWVGASGSLSPRPHVVSFALLAVFTVVWLRTARDLRPRWWLVPVTWLWACSHGMWFAGVVVGLAVCLGLTLDRRVGVRGAARLAAVPVLGVLAAAVTPVGPTLLLAPLTVGDYRKYVTEWAPPELLDPQVMTALAMVTVVAIGWARGRSRTPWTHIAILAVAVGWTLLYFRTVPLGAAMLTPLFAGSLQTMLAVERPRPGRVELASVASGAAASLVLAALLAPSVAGSPGRMPIGLDDDLSRLRPGTVVFNEYMVGGWLLWRHRQLAPVMDPRTEVYSVPYVDEYMAAVRAAPGWERTIARSGATAAVLGVRSPLAYALTTQSGWVVKDQHRGYALLERP